MELTAQTLLRAAADGQNVTLTDPKPAPNARTTATIQATTAAALAGHIYQHTPLAASTALTVERIASPRRAILTSSVSWMRRRILVGDHTDNEYADGCLIVELCGHTGCAQSAPAGPGTRCSRHFTDPVRNGYEPTYWAQLAAEVWAASHKETGEEGTLWRNRRNGVVMGAVAAGMEKMEIHRITGIARTTIDRILAPDVAASVGEEGDPEDLYGPA